MSSAYNKIILMGNLTRDPQLKYLPNSQTAVAEFGIAVNHRYKTRDGQEREDVLFIDCACFGRAGEVLNQYCQKGKQLLIEGRLKFDTWEDRQSGGKRSKHSVVVENFQMLGGGGGAGNGEPQTSEPEVGGATRPPNRAGTKRQDPGEKVIGNNPMVASPVGPDHFNEDDIPF